MGSVLSSDGSQSNAADVTANTSETVSSHQTDDDSSVGPNGKVLPADGSQTRDAIDNTKVENDDIQAEIGNILNKSGGSSETAFSISSSEVETFNQYQPVNQTNDGNGFA